MRLFGQYLERLPIPEIPFTTPEAEREAAVEAAIAAYEEDAARVVETYHDTSLQEYAAPVLGLVDEHLEAAPERADVVHDLLAHLAREMTRLKEERHGYHLDIVDYVGEPSARAQTLHEVGRYQPAPSVSESLLSTTTEDYDSLRIGALSTKQEDDTVTVYATARYKPENPDDHDTDRWGYTETDPIALCTIHSCTDLEAGLVTHWLRALNDHRSGFANYRDNATKTNSPRDRILAAHLPDPTAVEHDLRAYLTNASEAATLDAQLDFTDQLIDQIVYRLYGLTEEEIAVVEGG